MRDRVICPFCFSPGGYFGTSKKKGLPYYRCEGCYACVFMNTQGAYTRFVGWCQEALDKVQSVTAARTEEILARNVVAVPIPIPGATVPAAGREPVAAKE